MAGSHMWALKLNSIGCLPFVRNRMYSMNEKYGSISHYYCTNSSFFFLFSLLHRPCSTCMPPNGWLPSILLAELRFIFHSRQQKYRPLKLADSSLSAKATHEERAQLALMIKENDFSLKTCSEYKWISGFHEIKRHIHTHACDQYSWHDFKTHYY